MRKLDRFRVIQAVAGRHRKLLVMSNVRRSLQQLMAVAASVRVRSVRAQQAVERRGDLVTMFRKRTSLCTQFTRRYGGDKRRVEDAPNSADIE